MTEGDTQEPIYIPAKHAGDGTGRPLNETEFSSDDFEATPGQSKTNAGPTQEQLAQSTIPSLPTESDRTVVNASPIAEAQEFYPTGSVASLARVLVGQQLDHYQLHELVAAWVQSSKPRTLD
jgi:hypothetical protein